MLAKSDKYGKEFDEKVKEYGDNSTAVRVIGINTQNK